MKKKLTAIFLCVALLAVAVVGTSLAYFTDTADQTNTFTAGSVGIKLDEAVVEKNADGDLVATNTRTEEDQSYKLYPGMEVTKDPTITLADDSEDSYVAAKITITCEDLWDLYGVWTEGQGEKYWNIDINKFVSGGLIEEGSDQSFNWNGLSMVFTDGDGNVYYQEATDGEWVIYVFLKDIYEAEDQIVLFDTITVDEDYDNDEMEILDGLEVKVEAFAVQAYGMATTAATDATDCFNAMKAAFGTSFAF